MSPASFGPLVEEYLAYRRDQRLRRRNSTVPDGERPVRDDGVQDERDEEVGGHRTPVTQATASRSP